MMGEALTVHQCANCQTCGVHEGLQEKCCGCYDGVCCRESVTGKPVEKAWVTFAKWAGYSIHDQAAYIAFEGGWGARAVHDE